MSVYIANFGVQNYEWSECLKRGTIATVNEVKAFELWKAGDRESYIQTRMAGHTVAGKKPTRAVAARWYNLMSIITQSVGDIWIHKEGPRLFWTRTTDDPATYYEKVEPVHPRRHVVVCHKPCEPWRNLAETGAPLLWDALHPKAKDFLATEATLQRLTSDNAAYAIALIRGEPREQWHTLPVWKSKAQASKNQNTGARFYGGLEKCIWRMANTAFHTTAYANGQQVEKTIKNKDCMFTSPPALEAYIRELIELQEGQCALTGLKLNFDDPDEDPEMLASLDRIDSAAHYEQGNLQVVCRFINRWKGADDNAGFKRLIDVLMS